MPVVCAWRCFVEESSVYFVEKQKLWLMQKKRWLKVFDLFWTNSSVPFAQPILKWQKWKPLETRWKMVTRHNIWFNCSSFKVHQHFVHWSWVPVDLSYIAVCVRLPYKQSRPCILRFYSFAWNCFPFHPSHVRSLNSLAEKEIGQGETATCTTKTREAGGWDNVQDDRGRPCKSHA